MENEDINLRRLSNTEEDYKLLEKWYKEEEIYSHFEQRILNYEEIINKYYPRTLSDAKVPVYIIEYNHNPVGIIQYQLINDDNKELYNLEDDNSYELDVFVGELNLHNKGIGRKAVKIMATYLFQNKKPSLLVMCPLKENINAIKCYEKVGFTIKGNFKTEDTVGNIQNYVLMILKSNDLIG